MTLHPNAKVVKLHSVRLTVEMISPPGKWVLHSRGRLELLHSVQSSLHRYDGWDLRNWLLAVKTAGQTIQFLRAVGRFSKLSLNNVTDIEEFQGLVRKLLLSRKFDWDGLDNCASKRIIDAARREMGQALEFGWDKGGSLARIHSTTALNAFLATVQFEQWQDAKFAACQRDGCFKVYKIDSKHARKYCDDRCAKHESVKRFRTRQRLVRKVGVTISALKEL